jgi:hypothetical protein
VEAWIKSGKSQKQYSYIFGGGWAFGRIYGLRLIDGKRLDLSFNNGATGANVDTSVTSPDVSATLLDGNWHQVAAVLDRTRHGEIRLYLDGRQIKTDKPAFCGPFVFEDGTMGFCVGALVPWDKSSGFEGAIDEVRVSNIVRPQYGATYPLPATDIPVQAAKVPFSYNAADSRKPLIYRRKAPSSPR